MEIEYKQFVIVPKKPKMSTGKIASQAAHATFMALENQKRGIDNSHSVVLIKDNTVLIDNWKDSGMCVIVLQCKNSTQLMGIAEYLKQWNIPYHLYIDEGITEVDMGTPTALATGVMTSEQHWMLSQLELYK